MFILHSKHKLIPFGARSERFLSSSGTLIRYDIILWNYPGSITAGQFSRHHAQSGGLVLNTCRFDKVNPVHVHRTAPIFHNAVWVEICSEHQLVRALPPLCYSYPTPYFKPNEWNPSMNPGLMCRLSSLSSKFYRWVTGWYCAWFGLICSMFSWGRRSLRFAANTCNALGPKTALGIFCARIAR